MDKEGIRRLIYKLFDSYYDIVDINDYNLDKKMNYYNRERDRLFYTETAYDRIYLSYRKRDREYIKKLIPVSDYMFNKHIKGWFINKFNVKVDSVLLPR